MHMSWRRGRQTEYQASIKKFLDRSKDSLKRLKALKISLGVLVSGGGLGYSRGLY